MIELDEPIVLDTGIVLLRMRGSPVGAVIERDLDLDHRSERPLVCAVTAGEAIALANRNGWSAARITRLRESLYNTCTLIGITASEMHDAYAELVNASFDAGEPIGQNDLWIAACARVAQATLITTDADFNHLAKKHIRRVLIDPLTGKVLAKSK